MNTIIMLKDKLNKLTLLNHKINKNSKNTIFELLKEHIDINKQIRLNKKIADEHSNNK